MSAVRYSRVTRGHSKKRGNEIGRETGSTRRRAFFAGKPPRAQRSVITRRRAGSVSTSVIHVECRSRSVRLINSGEGTMVRERLSTRAECSPPPARVHAVASQSRDTALPSLPLPPFRLAASQIIEDIQRPLSR